MISGSIEPVSTKNMHFIIDLLKFAKYCKNAESREEKWLSILSQLKTGFSASDAVFAKALERIRVTDASCDLIKAQ